MALILEVVMARDLKVLMVGVEELALAGVIFIVLEVVRAVAGVVAVVTDGAGAPAGELTPAMAKALVTRVGVFGVRVEQWQW